MIHDSMDGNVSLSVSANSCKTRYMPIVTAVNILSLADRLTFFSRTYTAHAGSGGYHTPLTSDEKTDCMFDGNQYGLFQG